MTRTFETLEVSSATYLEIRAKLKEVGFDYAIEDDDDFGERIDMDGFAIGAGGLSIENLAAFVSEQIQAIEADNVFRQEPANVMVNAPVALTQMGLKGKMDILQRVKKLLGDRP